MTYYTDKANAEQIFNRVRKSADKEQGILSDCYGEHFCGELYADLTDLINFENLKIKDLLDGRSMFLIDKKSGDCIAEITADCSYSTLVPLWNIINNFDKKIEISAYNVDIIKHD